MGHEPTHETIDIAHWKSFFALQKLRQGVRDFAESCRRANPAAFPSEAEFEAYVRGTSPYPGDIDGPRSIAVLEQLRDEFGRDHLGAGVPTDVFIAAIGEPAHPALTKIGGTPYRPARTPWPETPDGDPMTFVAQFCFGDSRDLLGSMRLPGDVLLVFGDPVNFMQADYEPDACYLEWHPFGLTSLLKPSQVPKTTWRIEPTYGVRHRTLDYPDAPEDESGESPAIVKGTKIGGRPTYIQDAAPEEGRFLAQLCSINPHGREFPLLNLAQSPWGDYAGDHNYLMLGDMGRAYLFQRPDGSVRLTADCS